jgi:hypothetical protein
MKWNTTNRLVMACLLLVPVLGLGLALGYWTLGEVCGYLGMGGMLGAVTANQLKKRRGAEMGCGPVAATTHLYEGTFCFWNVSGYLDDDTAAGANKFAGIVLEEVDNSSGLDGEMKAEYYQEGIFYLPGSGFAITDIGKEVFASDNYTITLTDAAAAVPIGVVAEYISSTELGVRIYGSPHQVSLEGNIIAFTGNTGANEIRVPDNLADGLSIEGTHGDFITFTSTDGAEAINMVEATIHTDNVTMSGAVDFIFSGTTGQCEIVVPDNVADALSIKDATGGADLIVLITTDGAERVNIAAMMKNKATTVAVAAAGATVADAGQLPLGNICHVSSDGATKGVKLPTGGLGDWMFILNDTATACELYAASGGTINGLAADASVVIPASKGVWVQATGANTWIAHDLPARATAS